MAVIQDVAAGFITAVKGMAVTFKEMFEPAVTVQYPLQKREMPERMRGMLVNDVSTCIACSKCVKICPVDCIIVEAVGKGKARKPALFQVDFIKCCWCALCVEVCPTPCLFMSKDYETVFTDKSQMIRDFVANPIPPAKTEEPVEEKPAAASAKDVEKPDAAPAKEKPEQQKKGD
jgi:NADH-quinone oxidoreductase subunit I